MADTQYSTKPVIGISGGDPKSESVKAMMRQIEQAGGTAIMLTNHTKRDAANDLGKIDALVVMGNNADIDPAIYGQQRHPKTFVGSDSPEGKARADYEMQLMKLALDCGMPTMGVCAGMQMLNVINGGDLHQDVAELTGNDEHAQQNLGISFSTPVQPVMIENNSKLGAIADEIRSVFVPDRTQALPTILMENSMHHQAIDRVGNGLRAVAFAEDEITTASGQKQRLIEAIEADPNGPYGKQFVIGVQWHPEFGASPLGPRLATQVVNEGLNYALANKRQHLLQDIANENAISHQQNYTPPSPPKDPEATRIRPGSMAAMVMMGRAQAAQRITGIAPGS